MSRSMLGILLSILMVFVAAPAVFAADGASVRSKKSTSAKKSTTAKKSHAGKKAAHATHHAKAARHGRVSRAHASKQAHVKMVKRVAIVHGRRHVVYQRVAYHPAVPAEPSAGELAGLNHTRDPLDLNSNVALVVDQTSSEVLFEKNANIALPIASITKLMTSMIVVEARQDMGETLVITDDDVDRLKNSSSRLQVGTQLTRGTMLHLALMSSENRAASALGRNYPGGLPAFVAAMNAKARALGMNDTRYVDANGLSSRNVASARDLAKLVVAAEKHPIIGHYSTDTQTEIDADGKTLQYRNTNHLVSNPDWVIGLQKTGYIHEAGRCLVMQTLIDGRPIVMVFLDSKGKASRLSDAGRIRKWLEEMKLQTMTKGKSRNTEG